MMRYKLLGMSALVAFAAEGAAATVSAAEDTAGGFVSKLTVSRLGNPKKVQAMDGEGAVYHVCDIFGIIRGTKPKALPNGDMSEALIGDFEGHNSETGAPFSSGVLYLPAGIQEQAVNAYKGQGENAKPMKFGIAIFTKKSTNLAGYEYLAKKLIKEEAADPLSEMRNIVVAGRLAPKQVEGPKVAAPAAITGAKKG